MISSGQTLTVGDLIEKNELYTLNYENWLFLQACYDGTRELLRLGYLPRHERESVANYRRRLDIAYGYNYSKSIVDLMNFYLFQKPVRRDMGRLKNDPQWKMFMDDCDLYGNSFDDFLTDQGRNAEINGAVGILVDKTNTKFETRKEEIENRVYPYVSAYWPVNIYDWEFRRDSRNRPYLAYLKLLDDDGQFRLWWTDKIEVWSAPDEVDIDSTKEVNTKAKKIIDSKNPLGKIPFIWLYNMQSRVRPIGISDIQEVGKIDVSIMNNLSQGEEVIDFAAFPMMRKPMREVKPMGNASDQSPDDVGPSAILEFDPEVPESKPDWLESKVREPLEAILEWISKKTAEIYRVVNAGGITATEVSKAPKSGTALTIEFQMLNAALVRKAINLEKAEKAIINFWLQWQKQQDYYETIEIKRDRNYNVENLAVELENILTSMTIVKSSTFRGHMQKMTARKMLPNAEEKTINTIDKEIDSAPSLTSSAPSSQPIVPSNENQPTENAPNGTTSVIDISAAKK